MLPKSILNFLSVLDLEYTCDQLLSHVHVRLFVTLWTVARQAPLSIGFPRQEYCSGLPFPSPGDLPYPGIKLESSVFPESPP